MLTRRDVLTRGGGILAWLAASSFWRQPEAKALTTGQGQVIVANALSLLGVPYVYGAPNFPKTTDCSRLTQACYASAGILIPRTAADQYRACRYSSSAPGALVFFATLTPGVVSHVGVNLGNGWMVDANSVQGMVVKENWASSTYWRRCFVACATL